MSVIDDLKKQIKESLTPEEYSIWEKDVQESLVGIKPGEYYAIIGDTSPKDDGDTSCAVRNFFRNQRNLPPEMRQNYCHISCHCKRCNPCM